MKIALVGPSVAQKGGVVSVLKELKNYLGESGVDAVFVATTDERRGYWGIWTYLCAIFFVFRSCLFQGCDVIHLHMASRGSCLRKSFLAILCFLFRKPYILHLHGGGFQYFYEHELNAIGRCYVRFIFRRADCVVALSHTWQRWIEGNLSAGNTQVIFNGVSSVGERISNNHLGRTVLFLGRVCEKKGIGELITAARNISQLFPDVIFELGGDGELARYSEEAADLSNVKFLGWLDNSARGEALDRASIFCLPSWSEGLPMSVLEAMAVGLPIVSTTVGGIPDAVEDGVTGLLVSPSDPAALSFALSKILSDTELAVRMGRKGRERQQIAFSRDSMGAGCLALYKRCVEAKNGK